MVQYYVGRKDNPKTKDEAMRQVADFVYNVFKYHLVKYLGLFDVFFRYQISKSENIAMEDVAGLGLLLQKLEYNALSPNARKVSDYGVFAHPHLQKPARFPAGQSERFHPAKPSFYLAAVTAGITHYTLQTKSCAKGVPFGNPVLPECVATIPPKHKISGCNLL